VVQIWFRFARATAGPGRPSGAGAPTVWAPVAGAQTTFVRADGSPAAPIYAQLAAASLVPTPPGAIVVLALTDPAVPTWCYGLDGCFDPATGDIALGPAATATVFDHAFDWRVMTPAARGAFLTLTHERGPWYVAGTSETPAGRPRPDEVFADIYGMCVRRRAIRRARLTPAYDFPVTPAMFGRACVLIRSVARIEPPRSAARYPAEA
jgi:hypothetical protein